VAVIGAGVMGADHARIISSEIPGAELRCICDADETRARSVADATGAPLEDWKAEATSDVRSAIGIDDFVSRKEAVDRMN